MEQKPLGRTGRTISALGLGTAPFGREIDEETSYRVMDYAVENGITFFDTAEIYGGGQSRLWRRQHLGVDDEREVTGEMSSSERIVGTWMRLRGCRNEITLCTKVMSGGSAENIPGALQKSLERLETDRVDMYKMHAPDANTPISETMAALTAEVDAGHVEVVGCSNYSAVQLREALDASAEGGYRRFEVVQPPYNLTHSDSEKELFPLCKEEEIAITSYSPLGAGFLTGKYTPDSSALPRGTRFDIKGDHVDDYFSERNFRIADRLRGKAAELGVPMVRLAMAWAMANQDITAVIVGARTTAHIDNALMVYETGIDPDLRAEMSIWTLEPDEGAG